MAKKFGKSVEIHFTFLRGGDVNWDDYFSDEIFGSEAIIACIAPFENFLFGHLKKTK